MKERDKIHKKLTDKFDELFDLTGKDWDRKGDDKDTNTERGKNEDADKKDALKGVMDNLYSENTRNKQARRQKTIVTETEQDREIIKKLAQQFEEEGEEEELKVKDKDTTGVIDSTDTIKPASQDTGTKSREKMGSSAMKADDRLAKIQELSPKDELDKDTECEPITPSDTVAPTIEPRIIRTGNRTVGVVHYKDHILHKPEAVGLAADSPENPKRVTRIMDFLHGKGIFDSSDCTLLETFEKASEEDILAVHTPDYHSFVKSYSKSGGGFLGNSTYMCKDSYEAALYAAGGGIFAGKLVAERKYDHTMAIIRPPGHHASADKYGGFCIFNNGAVLAKHMQRSGYKKVMIIDWDVHAGNGTMDIFYKDPTVLTLSIHQDAHDFYPKTGFTEQIGEGAGKGYTINVELPEGAGDDEYSLVMERVVLPAIKKFAPDFVIGVCGLDAHYKDTHSSINMTSTGYYNIASTLTDSISCPFAILLEGGYHEFNNRIVHSVLMALLGKPDPQNDSLDRLEYEIRKQKAIYTETEKRIARVKKLVSIS